ncbi:MAG TPA: hypothetical protein VLH08_04605 [Acidobacteriota bacterium]|nr:hypothetical protein [Acidobacteriota bacterium]
MTTPLAFGLSLFFRNKLFLPLFCSIPACIGYLSGIRTSLLHAFGVLLLWTFVQSSLVIVTSKKKPDLMKQIIMNAEKYSDSMFQWIETGMLPEGNSSKVIQAHLKQTILYCALAVLSANCAAIFLGCVLLNYMNYYVAQLANRSRNSLNAIFLGWNFWSVIRVLSFLWLGAMLGLPFASHFFNTKQQFEFLWLLPGIMGIILDLGLKLLFSKWWRRKLSLLLF